MTNLQDGLQRIATQISVSDLERSTRFYCEGLGFAEGPSSGVFPPAPDSEIPKMLGLPGGCTFQNRHLLRPDGGLEMVQLHQPEPHRERMPRLTNVGAKGLLFNCRDAAALAGRLVELGGTLIYGGKDGATGTYPSYFVADPDGIQIQLVSVPPEALKTALDH